MDKMTVYDKAYNKAKLALKLQIEIILESYRKDLANVMDDDELCLCTIRINGTPVPRERYKRFAPTVRYPFLRLLIGSKFLIFFPFISKRYDSLRTRARLASA